VHIVGCIIRISQHTSQHFLEREIVTQKHKIQEGFGRAVLEVYWFNPHSWNMLWRRVYVPKLVISCVMLRSNVGSIHTAMTDTDYITLPNI